MYEPLTIMARLRSPIAPGGPLMLDSLLFAGLGFMLQEQRPEEDWIPPEEVFGLDLPLARIETPVGWWWAASQATPEGPEAMAHHHKRPMAEHAERWTTAGSLNQASGPDKALRTPHFYRPSWLSPSWTCCGDLPRIAEILTRVQGLGKRVTDGWGWVDRWEIRSGGPALEAYGRDVALRHLPVEVVETLPSRCARRRLPLRPPYYDRTATVPCFQVPEVQDV